MSKQIVVSGNKILAHGEDCFSVTNNTVLCSETGRVFQNATVVTVDEFPDNIDSCCYEYDCGEFKCDIARTRYFEISVDVTETSAIVAKLPDFDANRHCAFIKITQFYGTYGDIQGDMWTMIDIGSTLWVNNAAILILNSQGGITMTTRETGGRTYTLNIAVVDMKKISLKGADTLE